MSRPPPQSPLYVCYDDTMKKDWTVYILECKNGAFYTGITKDLKKRLAQHNAGTGAKYTRANGPCRLVYEKKGFTESIAKKEEARIKKLSRKQKEALL